MKEQLALLQELQHIDLELDELNGQKGAIADRLTQNKEVLSKLEEDLEGQKTSLEEIRTMQRSKELDLKELNENLKERKKRQLNVGSTKEYNAVEKEIESLQKSTEQTEEELLHLGEVIEETEASINLKSGKVKELRKGIEAQELEVQSELNSFDRKIKKLKNRANQAREAVSARLMYKYDFIRGRRPGLAVVSAQKGHCEGCFMSLPPQQFIQVQRGETMESCPSCQRILYFTNAQDEEAIPA